MPGDRVVVEPPSQPGQLGGVDQPDADRVTVPPAELLDLLDGVAERVPVVEDLTAAALAQVRAHDVGLDPHRALDQLAQRRSGRVECGGRIGLDEVEDGRVAQEARPSRPRPARSRGPRGAALPGSSRSQSTPAGGWNAPTRFLPSPVFTAGLAADRGVDHAEQRWSARARRGRRAARSPPRSPARSVTAPPPSDTTTSERVNACLPEQRPELGRDLDRLRRLTVGHGARARPSTSPSRRAVSTRGRQVGHATCGVHQQHLRGRVLRRRAGSSSSTPAPTTTSYGDSPPTAIRVVMHDTRATTSSATSSGDLPSVLTVKVATCS